MADESRESIAHGLVHHVNRISELSKDQLADVAAELASSGPDLEKLERLAKLARKASSRLVVAGDGSAAYHY